MIYNSNSEESLKNKIQELQERLDHLEEVNRFTLDALELASSLMDFQPSINKLESPALILEETCTRVARIINFNSMVIYLVDEKDSDFYPAYSKPESSEKLLQSDISKLIDQGFFSWAMREKKPLTLASSKPGSSIILSVIATSSRVRGMFVGLLETETAAIPDVSWSLLSIILSSSANALESFELYKIFKETNVQLKKSILTRTRQLEVQASYDQLTHLPNRDMIFKKLEQHIRYCNGNDEQHQVAFLLIDLDMFKDVNESLGHEAGDKLLVQVGFRLREIVHDQECLARMGGDEFAVILTGPDCKNMAMETAGQIIKAMAAPFEINGHILVLDVSIGIAIYPEHGKNMGQILSKADVAMYASKRRKAGYTLYDSRMDSSGINRLNLMGELKKSLDNNELTLYFQPKINLPLETVCGAEALIRWIHPTRGFIPPSEFIPLAEQGGLIRELTRKVIHMASTQIRDWLNQGIHIPLSINLSVRDLQEGRLPERVFLALQEQRVEPEMLEMEITESAFITAPGKSRRVLKDLNEIGVLLSIDDFGTGYSSIAYLKDLPVQQLKIDRSFVMHMHKDKSDARIVKSITDLGHNLNLKVVAEGVENHTILEMLKGLGCDMAQGFHIMKPAPVHEFTLWLKSLKQDGG